MSTFEKVRLATEALRHVVPDFQKWFEGTHPDGREGLRLLESGNYAEAEKCFQRVLAAFKDRSLPRGRYARVLLALATTQWKQKRLTEARETAESVRELLEGAKTKSGPDLIECLDLLGRIYSEEENFAAAEAAFQQALDIDREAHQADSKDLVERYRRLGGALRKNEKLQEAKAALEEALRIAEKAHGPEHVLTADCLFELGQCLSARAEHEDARGKLEKALDIHKQVCGRDSEEVARDYQALAAAAHEAKDLEASVTYYEKALHLRERQLGGNAAELAMLLVNLATVHSHDGRPARALELLQQAVPRLEGARDERAAAALNHLGVVYVQSGRYEDAVNSLRRARQYWEKAPDKNRRALDANSQLLAEMGNYLSLEQAERLLRPLAPAAESAQTWPAPNSDAVPPAPPADPVFPWLEETEGPTLAGGLLPQDPPESRHVVPPDVIQVPPSFPGGVIVDPSNGGEPAFYGSAYPPPPPLHPVYTHPPAGAAPVCYTTEAPLPPPQTGAPPPAYYPYYQAPQAAPGHGDPNVQLTFVRPDGTPLEQVPHQSTLHLTVMVPDNSLSQKTAAPPVQAVPEPPARQAPSLCGWEDLAFEFLSTT